MSGALRRKARGTLVRRARKPGPVYLARGFEPDTCFYARNAERIRGKEEIDLTVDPPPDLVIEIDITSPSLNKLPIYAAVGVPEVWRYNSKGLTIFRREGGQYHAHAESSLLPGATGQVISQFLEDSQSMKRTAWVCSVREWARERTKGQGGS